MNDSVFVEEDKAVDHLTANVRDLLLRQALGQVDYDGVQGAAVTELHEHLKVENKSVDFYLFTATWRKIDRAIDNDHFIRAID